MTCLAHAVEHHIKEIISDLILIDFLFKLMTFGIAVLPHQSILRHIQIHKYKTEKHTKHDTYKAIHLNNTQINYY